MYLTQVLDLVLDAAIVHGERALLVVGFDAADVVRCALHQRSHQRLEGGRGGRG